MVIAGEASGDLHGAGVVRELKRRSPSCDIFGIGGDKMRDAGMDLVYHVRELAIVGFWEVVEHLPLIRSVQKTMTALLTVRRPDVVLLIDYPGFNLRFAQTAHARGIKIVYYISPQVWAWNPGRVKRMQGVIDKMLVVFPFEVDIYRKAGIDVEFVGHPLVEEVCEQQSRTEFCRRYDLDESRLVLGLFPGSRRQELEKIFPAMLGAARIAHHQLGTQIVVGVASFLDFDYVKSFIRDDFPVKLIRDATHDVMKNSDVALVKSGTATLETGYFQTPMVIVYKTSWLSYVLARFLVHVKHIGLANIVAGDGIVPELIQSDVHPQRLAAEALKLLTDEALRKRVSSRLGVVKERLGPPGASARVAEQILGLG